MVITCKIFEVDLLSCPEAMSFVQVLLNLSSEEVDF